VFDKMIKESCPYHKGPIKHTLEECDKLRRYFNKAGPSAEDGKDQGNNNKGGDKEEKFPEVHNYFMIYVGKWRIPRLDAASKSAERSAR
jgi:hypothetical protein